MRRTRGKSAGVMRWYAGVLTLLGGAALALMGGSALAKKPPKLPPPDPGPANFALAFVRDGNLMQMTSDGNTVEMLLRSRDIGSAHWMPDGSGIAFTRSGGTIYAVDPDGSNERELFNAGLLNDQGARYWLRDGSRVVVRLYNGAEWWTDLGIADVTNGTVHALGLDPIFNSSIQGGTTSPDLRPGTPGWQGWFVFNARHLDHHPETNYTDYDLWTVWLEESVLTDGTSTWWFDPQTLQQRWMDGEQARPALSPDGESIAFISSLAPASSYRETYVAPFDLSTGSIGTPALLRSGAAAVAWSPDGSWCATSGQDRTIQGGNHPDILRIRPDGAESTYLTDNRRAEGSPSWNPGWVNDLDQ